ncbi:DUF1848 family protein [Anaeromicropila populeti]|nr:DUF1848 family protein [Anaeromicropila populeti]
MDKTMKNVISASRRADVVAQFYPWLLEKVKEGGVELQNPFFRNKKYYVSLEKDDIQAMVLWSKDFTNFVRHPKPLDIYSLYFQYTINLYDKAIENVKLLDYHIVNLKWIIDNYGAEKVAIRFDPVMFVDKGNGIEDAMNERKQIFETLLDNIDKHIMERPRLITSYIDLNSQITENLDKHGIHIFNANQKQIDTFFKTIKKIADERGFALTSCADVRVEMAGIERKPCIDGNIISSIEGEKVSRAKDASQRKECLCTKSIDIGIYPYLDGGKKCIHSCKYCYVKGAI